MAEIFKIKKGLDIPLGGAVAPGSSPEIDNATKDFAIVPDDFPGLQWKVRVKPGDEVKAGAPLLSDKETDTIVLPSPVDGVVKEVRRGERRKVLAVVVEKKSSDSNPLTFTDFSTRETSISTLCRSGLWAFMRQRPYDIIPSPAATPRDIFVTGFDSAPLATDMISPADKPMLEEGLKVLASLTDGSVYLNVKFGAGISSAVAKVSEFDGPHPAGNVGVQIAKIKPVNKDEVVWALDARTVVRIGKLKATGVPDYTANVAICGDGVKKPCIVATTIGASLSSLLNGRLDAPANELRIISGNVLTGVQEKLDEGFLRYPYRQVTVIPEGANADEFMGWASLNPNKFSVKRSFPTFLHGKKPFNFDARIKGGHRAMILSGEYDKVFPMDIYPEYLIKAIEAGDIDRMEKLGIYEVAPEDFALPEFVDTSKLPLQQIVRQGLDNLRKELS